MCNSFKNDNPRFPQEEQDFYCTIIMNITVIAGAHSGDPYEIIEVIVRIVDIFLFNDFFTKLPIS